MSLLEAVTTPLAALTLLAHVALGAGLIAVVAGWFEYQLIVVDRVARFIGRYGRRFACAVAVMATAGSLLYSEVVRLEPCSLCWYQRIFMYPIAIILAIALVTRDHRADRYAITLAGCGIIISFYQYALQFGGPQLVPCSADVAASCARRYILAYGYITIPLMTATAFALIIVSLLLAQRHAPAAD